MGILSAKKIKGKILFLGLIIVLSCGYIILTVNNIIWRKNIESITNYTYLSGAAIEEICQRDISLLTELSEKIGCIRHSPRYRKLKTSFRICIKSRL